MLANSLNDAPQAWMRRAERARGIAVMLGRKDAAQWIERKQRLPQEVQDMERDYKAIQAVDLAGLAAAIQKAQADWPDKKADLDARLAAWLRSHWTGQSLL